MPKKDLYNRILGLLCSVFEAYSAVLFLPENNTTYKLASFFSLGDNILTQCRLKPGQGLVGWVLRENQPLLVNDFERTGNSLGYYSSEKQEKIKAFMGCPLERGQGALCLDTKRSQSFSTKDQKILHQFALLVQDLQNDISPDHGTNREKHYYACLQTLYLLRLHYRRWSDYLHAFLCTLSQYTDFTYCFFASRDSAGKGYFLEGANRELLPSHGSQGKKFDIEEGLVGWVFRNNTMLHSLNRENSKLSNRILNHSVKLPELQSAICLPIMVRMRTRGVLVLADHRVREFSKEEKEFLHMVTEYLSLFLENLYLKSKLRGS
ncbi:MAG: GAF domain-containing protein [Desulfohalobiaceae bacterium]|nr:GAF domain-containing protein [Desulfohalobiaceae bacterium]